MAEAKQLIEGTYHEEDDYGDDGEFVPKALQQNDFDQTFKAQSETAIVKESAMNELTKMAKALVDGSVRTSDPR